MAWTFCTKEDVVSLYPIQTTELKDSWSEMAEGLIRDYLGQKYLGDTEIITNEISSGDGSPIIYVKYPPIYSVQSVVVGGLQLSPDEYVVEKNYIHLRYVTAPMGNLNVVVNYTSGKLDVSENVRLCAATMIVAMVNYKRRFGSDGSLKWGQAEQRAGENDANTSIGLMGHLQAIMKETLKRPKVMVR